MKKRKKKLTISEPRSRFRVGRVKSCPFAGAKCVIVIDDSLMSDLSECVAEIANEFVIFFLGRREGRVIYIDDAYVPEQTVTAATVESAEPFSPSRYVAVAHSHHAIGAFHSSVDEEGVDNAPVSIVMSTRGWCAKVAHRLPCGRWGVSSNVDIIAASDPRARDVIARAQEETRVDAHTHVSRARMGDCPDARDGARVAQCGVQIRDNRLLIEVRSKSKPGVPDWALLPNFYLIRRGDD